MSLSKPQADALRALQAALEEATEVGLLDELQCLVNSPDSINDVCDSVDCLLLGMTLSRLSQQEKPNDF